MKERAPRAPKEIEELKTEIDELTEEEKHPAGFTVKDSRIEATPNPPSRNIETEILAKEDKIHEIEGKETLKKDAKREKKILLRLKELEKNKGPEAKEVRSDEELNLISINNELRGLYPDGVMPRDVYDKFWNLLIEQGNSVDSENTTAQMATAEKIKNFVAEQHAAEEERKAKGLPGYNYENEDLESYPYPVPPVTETESGVSHEDGPSVNPESANEAKVGSTEKNPFDLKEEDVIKQEEALAEPTIEHSVNPETEQEGVEVEKEAEEIPAVETHKEKQSRLREVVGKFYEGTKEKLGMSERGKQLELNLEYRSKELDAEAKKLGVEGMFRKMGEKYNKLSTREKIGIGIALGLGAGGLAAASVPAAFVFFGGIAAQRIAGLSSSFLKYEKSTQDGKWKKEKAMGKAMLQSAAMTTGMLLLVQEIKIGLDHNGHMFDANKEWLKHYWPGHAPEVPTTDVGGMAGETVAPIVAPNSPEMPAISAEASEGHGYEWMMKRMWEQMQDKHLDPSKFGADTDIHKLLTADANSIDKVVHDIASDPNHHFFNADGTSVQINPDDHLSILPDGQIAIDNATHDYGLPVHAPEGVHLTSAYNPEAVVEVPVTPAVEAPPSSAGITQPVEPIAPPAETPVPHTPEASLETEVLKPEAVTSPEVPVAPAETPVAPIETHTAVPEIPKVEVPVVHESVVNHFGIDVPKDSPHIYSGAGGKELFVYGGSLQEQSIAIENYLNEHPKDIVYGSSMNGVDRVKCFLGPDGKLDVASVVKESFWARFFSGNAFVGAPKPEEFEKIINIK